MKRKRDSRITRPSIALGSANETKTLERDRLVNKMNSVETKLTQ